MKRTFRTLEEVRALMTVGRGQAAPDLLIVGGTILNVYSGELHPGTIAVAGGRIAYVRDRALTAGPQTTVIDARGRILAPGYIDPHTHIFALCSPDQLAAALLPRGTTTVVADTLMLLLATPPEVTPQVMDALAALPMRHFWFLRLHAQSHSPDETTLVTDARLEGLVQREDVRTVGELTRWPQVYAGDATVLTRIGRALAAGRRVEGHLPGVSADRLQVVAAAGVSSDHEAITAEQALARLRAGLYVMLRHGSIRPDLPALAELVTGARAFSGRLMLTPDASTPTFVETYGNIDYMLQTALGLGIEPLAAYQMATINPATYYALDEELGGLAPGRRADLVVLEDLGRPRPEMVIADGRVVARDGRLTVALPALPWERWLRRFTPGAWRPTSGMFSLDGLPSPAPAIHLEDTVITSRRDLAVTDPLPPGILRMALLDTAGRWRCRTLLSGFADTVGGLASSISNGVGLITLGRSAEDMAAAASRVLGLGGGVVLVDDGAVQFELPLPLAGMASREPIPAVAADLERLTAILRARGYRHQELAFTLLFLGFDSLPYVRLTYRGVWDVMARRVILPREDLG
ncbi:MAG: adenine deaminase [Armatimonadetes bacterium]|nr:adenine deaminase [Armatimonadota bacterium]